MLNPKYRGSTFDIVYSDNENIFKGKESYHCHLMTDTSFFNLVSDNWKTILRRVPCIDIDRVEIKKSCVMVQMKPTYNQPVLFLNSVIPEKTRELLDALNVVQSVPSHETRYLSLPVVLPTFKIDKNCIMKLHTTVVTQCASILTTVKSPTKQSGALVDIFECLYRMRFPDSLSMNSSHNVPGLMADIYRHMLIYYSSAIIRCMNCIPRQPQLGGYFVNIATQAASTVSTVATCIGISFMDLSQAIANLQNYGPLEAVIQACDRIAEEAKRGYDNSLFHAAPFDMNNLEYVMNTIIMAIAGFACGMYQEDVDDLASKTVDYTRNVVLHQNASAPIDDFHKSRKSYAIEMLRLYDGRPFDPQYHHVYVVFNLEDIERHSHA